MLRRIFSYFLYFSESICLQKPFASDLHKLDNMSEDLEDCYTDDGPFDDSFLRNKVMSQEGLNLPPEISNEEDNEIFDLDVNEEVKVWLYFICIK